MDISSGPHAQVQSKKLWEMGWSKSFPPPVPRTGWGLQCLRYRLNKAGKSAIESRVWSGAISKLQQILKAAPVMVVYFSDQILKIAHLSEQYL